MYIFGGEGLHQAAERQVGHREIGRLASDEEARNIEIAHPHGDGKARRAMGQAEVDQREVREMLGRGRHRAI